MFLFFFLFSLIYCQIEVLTVANFDEKTTTGNWFLIFYAPWCPHCKELLPIIEHASYALKPRHIYVGEVDTTAQKPLRDRYNVKGFPTLFFSKDGVVKPYKGGRSYQAIISYCTRASRDPVSEVVSANFTSYVRNIQEAGFLFVRGEDSEGMEKVFRDIAEEFSVYVDFAITQDSKLMSEIGTKHNVVVSVLSDGTVSNKLKTGNYSKEEMLDWIQLNQFSKIPTLEAFNFKPFVTQPDKLTALMCIDPTQYQNNGKMKQFFEKLIGPKGLSSNIRVKYVFAMMDAVTYIAFLEQFNVEVAHLPKLIILDTAHNTFFEDPEVDEIDEMESFLIAIANGKIKPNPSGFFHNIYRTFQKNFPISLIILIVGIILFGLFGFIIYESWNEKDEEPVENVVPMTTVSLDKKESGNESSDDFSNDNDNENDNEDEISNPSTPTEQPNTDGKLKVE